MPTAEESEMIAHLQAISTNTAELKTLQQQIAFNTQVNALVISFLTGLFLWKLAVYAKNHKRFWSIVLLLCSMSAASATEFQRANNGYYWIPVKPEAHPTTGAVSSGIQVLPGTINLTTQGFTKTYTQSFTLTGVFGTSLQSYEAIACTLTITAIYEQDPDLVWLGSDGFVTVPAGSGTVGTWIPLKGNVAAHWATVTSTTGMSVGMQLNMSQFFGSYPLWLVNNNVYPSETSFEFWLSGSNWTAPNGLPVNDAGDLDINGGGSTGNNSGSGNTTNNTNNNTTVNQQAETINMTVNEGDIVTNEGDIVENNEYYNDNTYNYYGSGPTTPTSIDLGNYAPTMSTDALQTQIGSFRQKLPTYDYTDQATPALIVSIPVPGTDGFNIDLSGQSLTGQWSTAYHAARLLMFGIVTLLLSAWFLLAVTKLFKAN